MNEADIPIDIHTLKLQDWLVSRHICPKNIQAVIRDIRSKITNALQDMPSNEQLVKLLSGNKINYYHCKEIVEILKDTEKDSKNLFGMYGSQRMKDWQEIVKLYERDNIYLAETAQIFVRNINFEIPAVRKQMTKLEQQKEECLKRIEDLAKPETQFLHENALLLKQLNVKGENLYKEFREVLETLPDLYAKSIKNIGKLSEAAQLYSDTAGQKTCLPILQHVLEFGNTTVYQYINKEAPLSIQEPPIKLNLKDATEQLVGDNDPDIDFGGDDNGATSSTISAEIIDFGDLAGAGDGNDSNGGGSIDWGIECSPTDAVEVNFDIPVEEYGIVVEGVGMDGGVAKGDQAFTLLDSPSYRERLLDEIFELECFLKMRCYELNQQNASTSIMLSVLDNISSHDSASINKMLIALEDIVKEINNEHIRHLFQLKHSPKYADIITTKLRQMNKAVEKIHISRDALRERSVQLATQRLDMNPILSELIAESKQLQCHIENDISKRYKNRVVNLIGGVN